MGKRIITQARGKGSSTYRVRKKAFVYTIKYPIQEGSAEILKIIHSAAHSAPLIKVKTGKEIFFNAAFNGAFEGQKIEISSKEIKDGNIVQLKNIPIGTQIYNIERNPGDGGKMTRTAGSFVTLNKIYEHNKIGILMPNKKEVKLSGDCRATIGRIAGDGRMLKPLIKAGKMFYKKKAKSKLYPRTSAVKFNAVDHPFGSGRGKRIKPKITQRNAPRGRRVGHLRPSRTGRKK
jgi:large subunit ribosomal protein L2